MSENNRSTAVLYCRYSSHNQRDVSIDQQVAACEAFAERSGIQIMRIYADRAMTGTNDRRPQFQQMISEAPGLGVQYVIVYSLDRFARDRYDSAVYKRELKQHGIRVLSATENISDDPTGVLLESMLEGLAEYYSAELARKIRRGLSDNASKGMVTGPHPYGYCAKDGHYEIVPEQAEIIREIYRRVLDGESRLAIIKDLNDRGVRTRLGGTWKRTSLETILKNERYTGVYRYGNVRIEGAMPQIIDRATFDAMQGLLLSSSMPAAPLRRRSDGGVYLLTGRVFCGHCGSPMVGVSGKSRSGALHYYYVCKGHRYAKTCDKSAIRRERLERDVAEAIRRYILTDDMIEKITDLAMEQKKAAEQTPALAALTADRAAAQTSLDNLMKALEKGIITNTTKARIEALEEEIQRIDVKIASERYAHRALDATKEEVMATLRLFQRGDLDDPEYRETLIDTFVQTVYVFDDKYKIVFHLGAGRRKNVEIPTDLPDESDDSPECSYKILNSPPFQPYTNQATIWIIGVDAFLLICPR